MRKFKSTLGSETAEQNRTERGTGPHVSLGTRISNHPIAELGEGARIPREQRSPHSGAGYGALILLKGRNHPIAELGKGARIPGRAKKTLPGGAGHGANPPLRS